MPAMTTRDDGLHIYVSQLEDGSYRAEVKGTDMWITGHDEASALRSLFAILEGVRWQT